MKIVMIIICLVFVSHLSSTIINVPVDQPTIQAGIDASVDADTVLVQTGTYYENINYNGKNITVASLFYTTQDTSYISQTIIDGNQNGRVVTFNNGEDSTAVLTGFTITNGFANHYGGGIRCFDSNPSLRNVIISNNSAENGGGIYCGYNSNINLSNSTLIDNSADYYGGAIFISGSSPNLVKLIIANNNAFAGGGIGCFESSPIIEDVLIDSNIAEDDGGGLFGCDYSTPILKNVIITNNSANTAGGGIFLCEEFSPIFENVTIANNEAMGNWCVCIHNSSASLINCILWNDGIVFLGYDPFDILTISYSDIQGGEAGIYTNNNGTINWLEGNIDADPLFVDPINRDYHLTENSPCIDAGDPSSPLDPDGTITDMGAFYYDQLNEIDENEIQNVEYILSNHPNPFNPTTTVSFSIPDENHVELSIYNIKGQIIKSLLNKQITAGEHSIVWNGEDDSEKKVSSGVYLYKLNVNGKTEAVKKCILLK